MARLLVVLLRNVKKYETMDEWLVSPRDKTITYDRRGVTASVENIE